MIDKTFIPPAWSGELINKISLCNGILGLSRLVTLIFCFGEGGLL